MWGSISRYSLYPRDGPIFFDELLKDSGYRVCSHVYSMKRSNVKKWWKAELKKPKSKRRDHAFWIVTESGVADEWGEDFPNGNLIFREDYQKSFKKESRYKDLQEFLKT